MNTKGQVTMFIIVGIVLLMSIAFIYYLLSASAPTNPNSEVNADVTGARTCLSQATRGAINALADDAIITVEELGSQPIPDRPHTMILMGESYHNYGGVNNFLGLCETQNEGCPPFAYHYLSDPPSMQSMLQARISQEMSQCLEQEGLAEVRILPDSIQVNWDEPNIEHVEFTQLQQASAWLGAKINTEIADFNHVLEDTDADSAYQLQLQEPEKSPDYPFDTYKLLGGGLEYLTFTIQNRPPLYWNEEIIPARYFRGSEMLEATQQVVCEEDSCDIVIYNLDEDQLTNLEIRDSLNNQLIPEVPQTCILDGNARPCAPLVTEPTDATSNPYIITIEPRCVDRSYTLTIRDEVGETLFLPLTLTDPQLAEVGDSCY